MATLSISESREYTIFQAFSNKKSFVEALDVLSQHDKANPGRQIIRGAAHQQALFESYKLFREAERKVSYKGKKPDYDDPVIVERLKNILMQNIPLSARKIVSDKSMGTMMNKANIGCLLDNYAKHIEILGKKAMNEQKRQDEAAFKRRQAQLRCEKHGNVRRGSYDERQVFSTESKYRPIGQILRDRIREGK